MAYGIKTTVAGGTAIAAGAAAESPELIGVAGTVWLLIICTRIVFALIGVAVGAVTGAFDEDDYDAFLGVQKKRDDNSKSR